MKSEIFWFLPTSGDSRYLGQSDFGRQATNKYIQQIAVSAENLGYDGLLIPTGSACLDPWVTASSLVTVTHKIKLLVAIRTALTSPTYLARQAITLDEASNGRLLLNVVPGGDPVELAQDGIFLAHDERYASADEFLQVWKKLFAGETVDYDGQYVKLKGAKNRFEPIQKPYPPLYFGGSSPAAHELAGKHVDAYLTWAEPLDAVAEKINDVREKAKKYGRTVRFGLRAQVIVRETEEEAWQDAECLISKLTDEDIRQAQEHLSRFDSVGQKRISSLHHYGDKNNLVIGPNLWAGVGLVRGGAGTALVGNPENVYARLKEYADLGIDTFVLSAYPHLEEAYRFAELVFPLLEGKKKVTDQQSVTGGAFDLKKTA
ncbi:MAG: FMNH2-dependent alkanesulfonate monooxygenase [Neisseriaceae bacterium]|nr:FMNH2-dependent alkanesulfonate monooxygenase [Neisseriaceae bacterium]